VRKSSEFIAGKSGEKIVTRYTLVIGATVSEYYERI